MDDAGQARNHNVNEHRSTKGNLANSMTTDKSIVKGGSTYVADSSGVEHAGHCFLAT